MLARPEYADLEPSLLDRALSAVLEQVGRALAALEGTGLGTAVGVVVLVAALALAGWFVARFLAGVRRDPAADTVVTGAPGRGAEAWLADAERHEREGRLAEVVRCRYRALVAALAAAGVVDEVPGRTTGDLLAEVRGNAPGAAPSFGRVTRAFEEAWYGRGEVSRTGLERFRQDERAVDAALRPRAGAGAWAGTRQP